jgi:hypothetical protein
MFLLPARTSYPKGSQPHGRQIFYFQFFVAMFLLPGRASILKDVSRTVDKFFIFSSLFSFSICRRTPRS